VSGRRLTAEQAADLAAFACRTELAADKPGNVTPRRGLPGLRPADFARSAEALRSAFARRRPRTVGALVLDAIRRTRRRVRTNTNLGLALVLAPLALASTRPDSGALRGRVERVLRSLSVRDAEQVYEAIRLAEPGGMGRVAEEDVSTRPRRNLRACMALAARRDAIACEYARGYPLTFEVAAPTLARWLRAGLPLDDGAVMTYLTLLTRRPDSLVARRHGGAAARRVSRRAARVLAAGGVRTANGHHALAAFDAWLRRSRLNPGTTADLTAAAIYACLADCGFVMDAHLRASLISAPRLRGRRRRTSHSAAPGASAPNRRANASAAARSAAKA
jgi:triphosphoribosyl-dephospho-CoA synthase